jgi:hypothetical protein
MGADRLPRKPARRLRVQRLHDPPLSGGRRRRDDTERRMRRAGQRHGRHAVVPGDERPARLVALHGHTLAGRQLDRRGEPDERRGRRRAGRADAELGDRSEPGDRPVHRRHPGVLGDGDGRDRLQRLPPHDGRLVRLLHTAQRHDAADGNHLHRHRLRSHRRDDLCLRRPRGHGHRRGCEQQRAHRERHRPALGPDRPLGHVAGGRADRRRLVRSPAPSATTSTGGPPRAPTTTPRRSTARAS